MPSSVVEVATRMIQTPRRVRQRLLLGTLTALLALGAAGAAAQTAVPSPVAGDPTVEEQLAQAQAQVRELSAQNDRLQQLLGAFESLYDPMEADRQLLVELRKPLPEDRPTAEAYLQRLQTLAIRSDPARLGGPASRVLETAPAFLDWRGGTFASQAERDAAFLASGAAGFGTDFQELEHAILLTVANRLDALLTLHDRIR
jgi:Tfp pilus assembly protein PilN